MTHRFTIALIVVLGLGVAGCGGSGAAGSSVGPGSTTENQVRHTPRDQVEDGGTFTWPLDNIPPNYNYNQLDGTELMNFQVIGALMPSAFDADPAGTPVWDRGLLASEPTIVTDPKQVITYEIHPKAAWSDGTPITWEDFYWQWKASSGTDKAYQIASSTGYDAIESVKRGASDREVVVTYAAPHWLRGDLVDTAPAPRPARIRIPVVAAPAHLPSA